MQSLAIPEEVCTAVCKDSREQFRPITIGKNHLAADHEMNIPSIVGRLNNFVLFLVLRRLKICEIKVLAAEPCSKKRE